MVTVSAARLINILTASGLRPLRNMGALVTWMTMTMTTLISLVATGEEHHDGLGLTNSRRSQAMRAQS